MLLGNFFTIFCCRLSRNFSKLLRAFFREPSFFFQILSCVFRLDFSPGGKKSRRNSRNHCLQKICGSGVPTEISLEVSYFFSRSSFRSSMRSSIGKYLQKFLQELLKKWLQEFLYEILFRRVYSVISQVVYSEIRKNGRFSRRPVFVFFYFM